MAGSIFFVWVVCLVIVWFLCLHCAAELFHWWFGSGAAPAQGGYSTLGWGGTTLAGGGGSDRARASSDDEEEGGGGGGGGQGLAAARAYPASRSGGEAFTGAASAWRRAVQKWRAGARGKLTRAAGGKNA